MQQFTIGLIGNPNCGKSTLFNALTGLHQRVGNWPGVTVDRISGYFELDDFHVEVVDLPGIYSLTVASETGAIDERIAAEYILSDAADLIVNVLDANNLERNLYLTTQLLELGIPVVLAVNMTDIAKKRGIVIDVAKLASVLGCPTVALVSNKKQGLEQLQQTILATHKYPVSAHNIIEYSQPIKQAIQALSAEISHKHKYFLALRLLENDVLAKKLVNIDATVGEQQQHIQTSLNEDADMLIADSRYTTIHHLVQQVTTESAHVKTTITTAVDKVVLNRILGIPIFLAVMYALFYFSINIGGAFQDFFQIGSNAIFVTGLSQVLHNWHLPLWLISVLTAGVGKGLNTTITFIPVLAGLFLFLAVLEGSGYMARAGFVIDRLMSKIGLPGRSFVPMLIGFGCNVPAIMAARTLDNRRDRILTVLMTPFMSCGARFAIYAVFTAAFFPKNGQNIIFALYIIGILIAVLTGLILRKTVLAGEQSSLVMELPPYHTPYLSNVLRQTWHRLKGFIFKAGKIIVPVCIVIGVLNSIYVGQYSVLSIVGQTITPIFRPMGVKQKNWPATVGLITGVLAKEVVVGTLNTLYTQAGDSKIKPQQLSVTKELKAAALSVPQNLVATFKNKSQTNVAAYESIYGQMYKKFDGQKGGFAYLLFILLYFPCIPAVATMFRELGWRWATFSMLWNTGLAYGVATIFYQAATFQEDPVYASTSIAIVVAVLFSTVVIMRRLKKGGT